jgi:hypothetical protein
MSVTSCTWPEAAPKPACLSPNSSSGTMVLIGTKPRSPSSPTLASAGTRRPGSLGTPRTGSFCSSAGRSCRKPHGTPGRAECSGHRRWRRAAQRRLPSVPARPPTGSPGKRAPRRKPRAACDPAASAADVARHLATDGAEPSSPPFPEAVIPDTSTYWTNRMSARSCQFVFAANVTL